MADQPAARANDPHDCPKVESSGVPHVGGPIDPPCSTSVLANTLGQARIGDLATCTGYPLKDVIIDGAATVQVDSRYAARVDNSLWHGGKIVAGSPDVLIGGPTITSAEFIKEAVERAKQVLKCAENRLSRWNQDDQALAKKWFGSDAEDVHSTLKQRVADAKSTIDKVGFRLGPESPNFSNDPSAYDPRTFAHVIPSNGDHIMYLDTAFWSSIPTGSDNQAGVLLHELSHFRDVGGTTDVTRPPGVLPIGEVAYGQQNALWLANNDPADALKNADNFEYFMEEVQETCK